MSVYWKPSGLVVATLVATLAIFFIGCDSDDDGAGDPDATVSNVADSGDSDSSASDPSRSEPQASDGLLDRTWEARSFQGQSLPSPVTIRFDASGRVVASGPCNSISGSYRGSGNRLTFGDLAMTEIACDDDRLNQLDSVYAAFLGRGVTYALTNTAGSEQLALSSEAAGGQSVVFTPRS